METESNKRLLGEFPAHTYEQWEQAAIQLLKGRSFEKTLITPTYEGFDLEPIYTRERMAELPHLGDLPGMGSRVRGSQADGYLEAGWLISQELSAPTPTTLNKLMLAELENGQNELNLWLDGPSRAGLDPKSDDNTVGVCGVSMSTLNDMQVLLDGIHTEMISLYLRSGASAPAVYALLAGWLKKSGADGSQLKGCLGYDPLGWLIERGQLKGGLEKACDFMAAILESAITSMPGLRIIDVQGHTYQNGGASSAEELAAVLATGTAYLKAMVGRGLSAETVAPRMRLSLSVGGNYFIEIAKFRAARLLWSRILEGFGVPEDQRAVHLHARTGLWNKTIYDPYVNMLRTTTEAFSAVVGGCDSLHVGPFDEIIRESDAFSRRIARNTHVILAEECGMTQVIDPAGGSWAVETLTDNMARESWKRFQDIEAAGGILPALQKGLVQESVETTRQAKMKNIQRRKDVIVGTNAYPNATEQLLAKKGLDYTASRDERVRDLEAWKDSRDAAAVKDVLSRAASANGRDCVDTLVEAAVAGATIEELMEVVTGDGTMLSLPKIGLKRAAEEYEALRLAALALSAAGKPAKIHQLNMGPSRRYRIRADWTSAFFQVAGFEVLNEDDYLEREAATAALSESGAKVVVITSDDETYAETVAPLAAAIRSAHPETKILVAGAPGEQEAAWREAGVDDFVHVRVNAYAFNKEILASMGAPL